MASQSDIVEKAVTAVLEDTAKCAPEEKMASQSDFVEKAVTAVLEDMAKYAPEEYKELKAEPAKKEKIIQAARATATETLKLTNELRNQPKDIAPRLSKHLSDERIQLIRKGLKIPTFRLVIAKREDGKHWLEFTRGQNKFLPSRALLTALDVDWGYEMQCASILVEVILLVMALVGVSVSPSVRMMQQVVEKAAKLIRTSLKLLKAIQKFLTAWKSTDSAYSKATAIFRLITEIYSDGILWTIIKFLLSDMAWNDWLETAVKVSVMILAAIETDGAATIAAIALMLMKAVDFSRKIDNISQLNEIKKTI